jgi:hypothetical protein
MSFTLFCADQQSGEHVYIGDKNGFWLGEQHILAVSTKILNDKLQKTNRSFY